MCGDRHSDPSQHDADRPHRLFPVHDLDADQADQMAILEIAVRNAEMLAGQPGYGHDADKIAAEAWSEAQREYQMRRELLWQDEKG